MANFAPLKNATRLFGNVLQWLTNNGFDVANPRSSENRVYTVSKYGCVAAIEANDDGHARIVSFPACLVAGEPAVLVDRGYQKFLKTSKLEIAATADHLENLHRFSEELKEALGYTSLYNEGLGTVSASYQYDRVVGRDLAEDARPIRPWQKK